MLRERIIKMQNDIRFKIDCMNQGGCVHFAYYFSKRLRELGIDHKIAFGCYDKIDLTYNYYIPSAHLMVYIPEIGFIDGINTSNSINYPRRRVVSMSLTKLDYFRSELEWNSCYETKQNSKLEKIINKFIK